MLSTSFLYNNNKACEELINARFRKYIRDTKKDWNYILPNELLKIDKSKVFILDVRKPDDYKKQHIKGAKNIFWLDLMDNLDKLPKNKEIIIVCYVGHTASQALVILKMLGYNARVLKFGMGVNKTDIPVAGWLTLNYPTVNGK
jgi:rhodanese-related sulfurtransferase